MKKEMNWRKFSRRKTKNWTKSKTSWNVDRKRQNRERYLEELREITDVVKFISQRRKFVRNYFEKDWTEFSVALQSKWKIWRGKDI